MEPLFNFYLWENLFPQVTITLNMLQLSQLPKLHIMDNEVSEDLKKYFEDSDIQFQLVPPHMNQRNASYYISLIYKSIPRHISLIWIEW